MTIAQFIASLLYMASWELPGLERYDHMYARRDLMRALRGVG